MHCQVHNLVGYRLQLALLSACIVGFLRGHVNVVLVMSGNMSMLNCSYNPINGHADITRYISLPILNGLL